MGIFILFTMKGNLSDFIVKGLPLLLQRTFFYISPFSREVKDTRIY